LRFKNRRVVGRESEAHPAFGDWVNLDFYRNIFRIFYRRHVLLRYHAAGTPPDTKLLSNRQFLVAQIADAQAQAEACGYIFITFMIATWYETLYRTH
jgi:hypothetical protein